MQRTEVAERAELISYSLLSPSFPNPLAATRPPFWSWIYFRFQNAPTGSPLNSVPISKFPLSEIMKYPEIILTIPRPWCHWNKFILFSGIEWVTNINIRGFGTQAADRLQRGGGRQLRGRSNPQSRHHVRNGRKSFPLPPIGTDSMEQKST